MKAQAGLNKRKGNSHNKCYWNRLKRQFSACAYDHTGAYSEMRQMPSSPEKMALQRHLELAEQTMATERYKALRERMSFAKNTNRLQRVLDHKVTA